MKRPLPRLLAPAGAAALCAVLAIAGGPVHAEAPGAKGGLLAACPNRSNCVSSDSTDPKHAIAPFRLDASPALAWIELKEMIEATPDTRIVEVTSDYMHVEFTTKRLQFTDDVEFLLRPLQKEIAVRSASRYGYYDFGANRERVEALRAKLRAKGIAD